MQIRQSYLLEGIPKGILKAFLFFSVLSATVLFPGCATTEYNPSDDTRTLKDLFDYLRSSDLKIEETHPRVRYEAILASGGFVMVIDGVRAEFYVYNPKIEYQLKKLRFVKDNGFIELLNCKDFKIPGMVNGKFVLLLPGQGNPDTVRKIKTVFKHFEMFTKKKTKL